MGLLTRAAKGSKLTHPELDANQIYLRDRHGFADYNDTATTGTPITLVGGTWTALTNNGLGAQTTENFPAEITTLIDTSTGAIDPTELTVNSDILVRPDFTVTPSSNNETLHFRYLFGPGGSQESIEATLGSLDLGAGVPYRFSLATHFLYIGSAFIGDNPIYLQVKLSGAGTVVNSGMAIKFRME